MLEIGAMLGGRYEILKRIGSGGMADVYMSKDHKLNRNVAVKVLKSEYVEDEKFLKKFQVEAQAIANLAHPNIVNIYDVGAEDGVNYIVMELADGMTLKECIKRLGHIPPKEAVDISIQIASAISHAHKHHTIHRDIKPQNILVAEDGTIKVTDFGIAKAANSNTVTSTAIGSVHYISPEQAKGRFCDEKSDIYSLGITMYEMVTGQVPFDHENGVTIALMHLQNEIVPPSNLVEGIPDSLEKIILKCTMKKPEERYQTADELIEDLKLVFSDTSGNYVGIIPTVDDSPTIMVDQEELNQQLAEEAKEPEDSKNAYLEEEDFDDDEGMNSKLEKLVIILAAVVGAIILITIIVFVVKSSGLFKSGSDTATKETSSITTAAATEEEEEYIVPNLLGMSLSQAQEAVGDNLKITTKEQSSSTYEAGQVIGQSIESDTKVEKGRTIILTISAGEQRVSIPDVKRDKQSSATKTLKNLGFSVRVETEYSSTVDEGYVISQSPSAGMRAAKNSTVTIVVSKGSNQVTVPNLRYYTLSEAKQQLSNMGLKLGSVSKEYSSEVREDQIISQSISSGKKVSKGTAIGVVISLGDEPTSTEATTEE